FSCHTITREVISPCLVPNTENEDLPELFIVFSSNNKPEKIGFTNHANYFLNVIKLEKYTKIISKHSAPIINNYGIPFGIYDFLIEIPKDITKLLKFKTNIFNCSICVEPILDTKNISLLSFFWN